MHTLLLIDNSNSFTKFATSLGEEIGEVKRMETRDLSVAGVRALLEHTVYDAAVMCSVVPQKAAVLEEALSKKPLITVSASIDLGIGIDYPDPASIGADRLANAAAAAHLLLLPAVVVDFGTALTFDIVNASGDYVGGVIAPGLESMTDYLHQRTALLPRITLLEPPGVIGKSTKDAMLAGAVYGYRGLVREILSEIRRALPQGQQTRVIATGGYAELIAAGVPEIEEIRQNLTLEGLRLIAARHLANKASHIHRHLNFQ